MVLLPLLASKPAPAPIREDNSSVALIRNSWTADLNCQRHFCSMIIYDWFVNSWIITWLNLIFSNKKNISSVHLHHDSRLSSFLNFLFNILEFWTEKYFIDLLTPDSPVLMLKEEIFPSNRRSSPVEFSSYSVEGFQTHQDVFIQKTWSWSESKQWFLSSRVGCFHLCLMLLFL